MYTTMCTGHDETLMFTSNKYSSGLIDSIKHPKVTSLIIFIVKQNINAIVNA